MTVTSSNANDSVCADKYKTEGELTLAYIDDRAFDPKSVFENGFYGGFANYAWHIYTKHFGLMSGFGFSYRYIKVRNDTSFIDGGSFIKKREAYNYIDAHVVVKMRFSGGNQQKKNPGFLFELGTVYNFPMYCRYTGRYETNKKLTALGIHQFTDFRAFVNVGYYPALLFFEYRLGDFIMGRYPEMPFYTIGVKIVMPTITN